ncbi:hypothetical protein V8Z69_13735 [Microbacterium aurugineum]|uniref:hypothetical protein n=1 Tax=Microbacterium aurugineum TaxID=2851642 RepID=UPI0039BDCB54
MAEIEAGARRGEVLLPGAHRVVRTLDGAEGPFAGALVTSGEGVAVRVDAATLSGWVGWRHAGAEHVAAPLDVVRRRGGHDVLLPWCTDRVLGFLVRRTAAGTVLTPGECSTLVISLLRGLHEVGEDPGEARSGEWWVTDGGRPVFVFGQGGDAREGIGVILERLQEHSPDKVVKRVLDSVGRGLEKAAAQPRLPVKLLAQWEQELLGVAAPQPLDRAPHAPERAREVARAVTSHDLRVSPRRGEASRSAVGLRGRRRGRRALLRPRGDRDIADRVRAAGALVRVLGTTVREWTVSARRNGPTRATESAGSGSADVLRRRALLIAGAAAAAVLAVGLLWPSGGVSGEAADVEAADVEGGATSPEPSIAASTEAGADSEATQDSRRRAGSPDPDGVSPEPDEVTPAEDDPAAAAAALLRVIADCRVQGDVSCEDAVAEGATRVLDALDAATDGTPRFELVDEYGDIAVVRVAVDGETDAANTSGRLIMVLLRMQEKWLVRDVYDVADQPG